MQVSNVTKFFVLTAIAFGTFIALPRTVLAQSTGQRVVDEEGRRVAVCQTLYLSGQYCPSRGSSMPPSRLEQFGNDMFADAFRQALQCGFSSRDGRPLPCAALANTGGRGRVVGLDEDDEFASISGTPYPKTMGDLIAKLPKGTKGITLADRCNDQTCPIYLNTSMNNGIGWIGRHMLAID